MNGFYDSGVEVIGNVSTGTSTMAGFYMESFGSPSSFFRMRAYDTTLAAIVYWDSTVQNASEYAGPGPLTDIVVLD